jgi:hypothetical protein
MRKRHQQVLRSVAYCADSHWTTNRGDHICQKTIVCIGALGVVQCQKLSRGNEICHIQIFISVSILHQCSIISWHSTTCVQFFKVLQDPCHNDQISTDTTTVKQSTIATVQVKSYSFPLAPSDKSCKLPQNLMSLTAEVNRMIPRMGNFKMASHWLFAHKSCVNYRS